MRKDLEKDAQQTRLDTDRQEDEDKSPQSEASCNNTNWYIEHHSSAWLYPGELSDRWRLWMVNQSNNKVSHD